MAGSTQAINIVLDGPPDLTDGFRDIAAAAVSQLPDGVVLDGVI